MKTETTFKKKLGAFFNRNYALFFAPALVAALYIAALFAYGVYPFGNKYTAASYDLSAQICPFIEHLFDVIQGKSTLAYSYAIMGGADVTGTFLYFFVSPFSFLFLIFGDGKVAHASSIVMLCKLMTIAFAGAWFAKKQFKNIPDYLCIAIGVVYTYCGYMFVANTYINWLDFLIYMPFCVAAFRYFVTTEKFLPFSITVACCIYTCFSIACFSLFIVYPTLIFYALLCVEKERRNRFIAYMSLSFAVALLMALPVLVPALAAFTRSARGGKLFENVWYGYNVASDGSLGDFDSSEFSKTYAESLYRKWSYIVSDTVFLALTIFWFIRTGLKDKFAQFMLVAAVMTVLPLLVDESMNLLNMGSYMSYALRFGFLNAVYFLGGACLAIDGWCFDRKCAYDGQPLWKKPANEEETIQKKTGKVASYICMGVVIACAVFIVLLLVLFSFTNGYKLFYSWFIKEEKLLDSMGGFSARFAHSLGGIEVLIVPFVLISLLIAIGCFMVAFRKVSPRFLSWILLVTVGMQMVFYNSHLVAGNASTQHVKLGQYQKICAQLNEREEGYFRVKEYNDELTACAPFTGNSNAFSAFSSMLDKDNFATYQLFGYYGNGKNSFKSSHNRGKGNRCEEFGDAFMGYKYFVVYGDPYDQEKTIEEQLKEIETNKPYLKKVIVDGNHLQRGNGNFYVYENSIVFPSAYRVSGGSYRFEKENTNNSTNRQKNQLALYKYLRGKDVKKVTGREYLTISAVTKLSEYLWEKAAEVEVGAGKITARVTAEKGEHLLLNFVASKGYTATVNGKAVKLLDNDLKFLSVPLEEGENVVVFSYTSPYGKYITLGAGGGILALAFVWLVLKKTKLFVQCTDVIAWVGILLAIALVAFFMLYPSCVFIVKLFALW